MTWIDDGRVLISEQRLSESAIDSMLQDSFADFARQMVINQ
jgi:hypothetical protein